MKTYKTWLFTRPCEGLVGKLAKDVQASNLGEDFEPIDVHNWLVETSASQSAFFALNASKDAYGRYLARQSKALLDDAYFPFFYSRLEGLVTVAKKQRNTQNGRMDT